MPSLLDKAISAIRADITKASRGTLSSFIPNEPHWYGQPWLETAAVDAQALITPQRMREVVMKVGTAAACMNAVLDYAANVNLCIRNVNPANPVDPEIVEFVERIMRRPNRNDNGLEFKQKILRDLFTMGMAALEIERGPNGRFANLNVLDMARLRIDYDEHGTILGYNMLNIYGMPITYNQDTPYAWRPEEVILIRLDPVSESLYGQSRVSQLFTYAVIESLIYTYISQRFTESNVPRGVFDLGDITEEELRRAIQNWNAQATSAHRIMLTGSKGASKWYPFNYNLDELQAKDLLNAIQAQIMAIVGVTKNELGDSMDVSKSNGYNLSYTFKKRAIEPKLNAVCYQLTSRFLWDTLHMDDLEFYYHEIDSRDELIQAQIDKENIEHGVQSINQVRNRRGDPNVEGGDEPYVWISGSLIPLRLAARFVEAQLAAVEAETQLLQIQAMQAMQAGVAGGQSPVEPPIIRGPGPAMKFTTPDGAGSSSFKMRLPKPGVQMGSNDDQGKTDIGQPPRGVVQTARNAGIRPPTEQ
jgi:HK97 family phage portal protein